MAPSIPLGVKQQAILVYCFASNVSAEGEKSIPKKTRRTQVRTACIQSVYIFGPANYPGCEELSALSRFFSPPLKPKKKLLLFHSALTLSVAMVAKTAAKIG